MIEHSSRFPPEYSPITQLRFGSVVTGRKNPQDHYLILDAKAVDNVHGSLIKVDKGGEYITAGEGGTMSVSEFGQFVRQLEFDEAMKLIKWGWRRRYNTDLPDDLEAMFKQEAKKFPLTVK